jgi:hypothetical protein
MLHVARDPAQATPHKSWTVWWTVRSCIRSDPTTDTPTDIGHNSALSVWTVLPCKHRKRRLVRVKLKSGALIDFKYSAQLQWPISVCFRSEPPLRGPDDAVCESAAV